MGRVGVETDFGAEGDGGEDASTGLKECGVGDGATEACDKVQGVVVEFFDCGDGGKDIDVA